MGPKSAQEGSKMVQDGPRWTSDGPRRLKLAFDGSKHRAQMDNLDNYVKVDSIAKIRQDSIRSYMIC